MKQIIWLVIIPLLYVAGLFIWFMNSVDAELSIPRQVCSYFLFIFGAFVATGWGLVCANFGDDLRMKIIMSAIGMIISLAAIWSSVKLAHVTSPFILFFYEPDWNVLVNILSLTGSSFLFGYLAEIFSQDKGEKSDDYSVYCEY